MLRIISGEFRRRLLATPPDSLTTRPIPDRVKVSMFQILRGHCEGATVFDVFAGVGAIGLEAVSRGATKVVMVERDRDVFRLLQQNVRTLGVEDRVELVQGDALGPGSLARCPRPVHLAFFDPPYPLVREPTGFRRVMAQFRAVVECLDETGYAVLRTPWPLFLDEPGGEAQEESAPARGPRRAAPGRDRPGRGRRMSEREIEEAYARSARQECEDEDDDLPLDDASWAGFDVKEESIDPDDAEADGGPMPEEKPDREPADLTVPGAQGPETHVYHHMAVHLYMRA